MKKKDHSNSILRKNWLVLITAFIAGSSFIHMSAQAPLYGPDKTPPKGASVTYTGGYADGEIGRTGGKVYTITNVGLSNTTTTYWSLIEDMVMLSMNGGTYSGGEILTVNASLSDLEGGIAAWTGDTYINVWNSDQQRYVSRYLDSKFVLTIFDLDNNPVPLVSPTLTGLDPNSGGAVLITGASMVFKARMEMFVSDDGGSTWTPHLDYYDDEEQHTSGAQAYSGYDYGFYWENDPPQLTINSPADVNEEDTVNITSATLLATDAESSAADIKFSFDPLSEGALPSHGMILYHEAPVTLPDTFALPDITGQMIAYLHDGSESTSDSIPFLIYDSDNAIYKEGVDSVFYYVIHINPIDDPPTVEINEGGSVDEDSALVINELSLLTTDPESIENQITYTLDPEGTSDFPKNGLLMLNGIPLSDGGTFTQSQINGGLLVYQHDGTETVSDGFLFQVEDEFGHKAANGESNDFFFSITVNPVNDLPVFTKSIALTLAEGDTAIVSNAYIAAEDSESGPEDILFTLDPNMNVENPLHGTVTLDETDLGDGDSFTMEDVNNGLVSYRHDGGESTSDFFAFNITDPQGGVAQDGDYTIFQFHLVITPVNDPPSLANPIPDQETRAEEAFSYTFPDNTFEDVDEGDTFTYSSYLVADADLPGWLEFDGPARTFSGTPEAADKGVIDVIVKAVDLGFVEVTDTFALEVTSPVGIRPESNENAFTAYPNPFVDEIQLNISESNPGTVNIRIINMLGDIVEDFVANPGSQRIINLNNEPAGIYFIRLDNGTKVQSMKIMKL